jgi:hypothetical protein
LGITPKYYVTKLTEIELTLKGSHFALLEILRKHRVYKLLWLVNDKASAMWLPRNDVTKTILFNLIEHGMKFHGKGYCDSSSSAFSGLLRNVAIKRVIMIIVLNKMPIIHFGSLSWLLRLALASMLVRDYKRSNLGRHSASRRSSGIELASPEEQGIANTLRQV